VIKNLDSCRRGYPFSSVDCGVDPEGFTPFARLADLYHTLNELQLQKLQLSKLDGNICGEIQYVSYRFVENSASSLTSYSEWTNRL